MNISGLSSNVSTYTIPYHMERSGSFASLFEGRHNAFKADVQTVRPENGIIKHMPGDGPGLSAADLCRRDSILKDLEEQGLIDESQANLIKSGLIPIELQSVFMKCGPEPTWGDLMWQNQTVDIGTYYHTLFKEIPLSLRDSECAKGYQTFIDALDEILENR